jgi:asparagine synthase (glutamine-hydrolysing)
MCGLVAMIALQNGRADSAVIERMSDALRHRGPDDVGSYLSGAVGFGFRRMSVLDLTAAGHQPMVSADGQLAMVFNGTIYNYIELRQELRALGHTFRSTGDTEVLLHAYEQWGRDMLPKLNGMWAVLIYDHRTRTLFGARDRFGIKPLYRYATADCVLFSSEIKGIYASDCYRGAPNWKRAARFLMYGRVDTMDDEVETFYTNISQIPAGSAFEMDLHGSVRAWRYWSVHDEVDTLSAQALRDPVRAFSEMLEDAVRLHLRSDAAIGVSLSGGLDSTSIISLVAALRAENKHAAVNDLRAFSYVSREFDETRFIAETVQQTGAGLYNVDVDPLRLWGKLDKILWYHDEPVHSFTALVGYEIYAAAASEGVKVILSGQGADEILAGYPRYFPSYWRSILRSGKVGLAWTEIDAYRKAYGGNTAALFRTAVIQTAKECLSRHLPAYRALSRRRHHRQLCTQTWFTQDLKNTFELDTGGGLAQNLDAALQRSVEIAPLPLYLRVEDRNAMAHSIEARVPYLDHRLVAFLFRLPPHWKMRGPWTKYLLRESMRGRIPESIRTRRDKMGFPTSAGQWFRTDLYGALQDLLASEKVRTRGIYNVAVIRRDLERHRSGEVDVSNGLFNVAQWESWLAITQGAFQ